MAEYDPRNFIQPCLLLLLRERSDHGYDLIDRLRELHAVDGEPGAVYRALRALERAGVVCSTWEASDAGPARRTYQVTPLGVATLDRQADILDETHRTLHLFRQRYQQLSAAGAGGASGNGNGARVYSGGGGGRRRNGDGGGTAVGGAGD